ncbi:MAG: T9SS type A sorting domain-containing protein, partial [Candidatus Marinimicrobia bacterium]|nr:T9SS type A sorting domain-containing protein [Candidatus Neomarinimicrobiota bacterium]
HNNYPNPFNQVTTISYDIFEKSSVLLVIYDITGKKIATLVEQFEEPGYHSIKWTGRNNRGMPIGSGMYLYGLRVGNITVLHKMILLK